MSRMPVVFSGHGSPMLALEHNEITETLQSMGAKIIEKFGKPKAILAVSAHWYAPGTYIQSAAKPRQVYDMYGFPDELYRVKYPVDGYKPLTQDVKSALGDSVSVNDNWGIDHGTWTVLCHMFPDADIPVVQLSVNRQLSAEESYEIGRKLHGLRDQGYLIFGSGNVVHNLRRVEWDNPGGSKMTVAFNDYIRNAVEARDDDTVIHYEKGPYAEYAVPTDDHYLPLIYILGAADPGEKPTVFNNVCNLGALAMTGFAFGI